MSELFREVDPSAEKDFNPYEVLGVDPSMSFDKIHEIYTQKVKDLNEKKYATLTHGGTLVAENELFDLQRAIMEIANSDGGKDTGEFPVYLIDKSEDELIKIWHALKQDTHLGAILAYMVKENTSKRDMLTIEDIKAFYHEFPTEADYMRNSSVSNLLNQIKEVHGQEKFNEYNVAAIHFADLMFPETA